MRKELRKILVTGGAGFMGSEFVRQAIDRHNKVIVVDKLTYAGDLERLRDAAGKYKFYQADISNKRDIEFILKKEKPAVVVHFAAETHVDRSIKDASPFIETNIKGTQVLADVSLTYEIKRFIHISTDEVYGEIARGGFREDSPLRPNSPYAASKAAADLLIRAYIRTYGFPAIIARPCNNYGPWQYPEKLIPLTISRVLKNQRTPVYKTGKNIREWLYVSDCARAILLILERGRLGEVYNIGSGQAKRNIDVVKQIISLLGKSESLIKFVKDRPGHDFRYYLNSRKLENELSWAAKVGFREGLERTVNWYLDNQNWLEEKIGSVS